VGAQGDGVDLVFPLVFHVGGDQVGGEDVAAQEELVIFFQVVEHMREGGRRLLDAGAFFAGEFIEVLIHGGGRFDAVLDAIESGHHHGGEGEVGVGAGVGDAELDAFGLGVVARDGDADAGAAVAGAIHEVDGGFVTGDQAAEGVGAGVGESHEGGHMPEQASDIVAGGVAESGVA